MILMSIVMVLPFIAVPIFWLQPLAEAALIYAVCLLVWGLMMCVMRASMKRPISTGIEYLIGKEATVLSLATSDPIAPYRIRLNGEIWRASSRDSLSEAETVVVVTGEGTMLTIKCKGPCGQKEET